MTSKRHHYVPQFYLRYFLLNRENTLWVYDKETGERRRQQPTDTAVIGGFYSFETPDGRKDDLEREFSRIESVAKPILDRWQERKIIPEFYEIQEIAYFLSLLHTRTPRAVAIYQETGLAVFLAELERLKENPQVAREMWEKICSETGDSKLPFETFLSFVENPSANYKIEVNEKVALGLSLRGIKAIVTYLLKLNWCLCEAPEPFFFLTCDAPLNVFSSRGSTALFGAGFGLDNVQVVFPISPQICLILDRVHTQKRRRLNETVVREINRRIAYMADRYVFSCRDAKFVRRLVLEAASITRGKPKIDREVIKRLHTSGLYPDTTSKE